MKRLIWLFYLVLLVSCSKKTYVWTDPYDLSVMSFNVRFDNPDDGEHQWSNRKEACVKMLEETKPSVVGIQEGLAHQVEYLDEQLPKYNYVGVGRDDGYQSGEFAAIYYLDEQFELVNSGNFWLSETPEYPSLGWDANNIRITTWVELKDRSKEETIFVFNAHFDHKGKVAREESAKLVISKISEIAGDDATVYLIGDLNAWLTNPMFDTITEKFYDARRFARYSDNHKSFNLWGKWYANWTVDYIFYRNCEPLAFRTVIEDYGVPYISDHYPLISHFNYPD